MATVEVLVGKLGAVDGHAAGALKHLLSLHTIVRDVHPRCAPYIATLEITTLKHEVGDDAVEDGTLVVQTRALLARAEGAEVLGRFGDDVVVELEVDTASLICPDTHQRQNSGGETTQSRTGGEWRLDSPLMSEVGLPSADMTGPVQATSKNVLDMAA